MKRTLALLVTLCIVISLAACASSSGMPASQAPGAPAASTSTEVAASTAASEAPAASGSKLKIAFVQPGVHAFFGSIPQAIKDATKDFGLQEVKHAIAQNWSQDDENTIIDGLVAQGYNAFVIGPGDTVAVNQKISELVAKGIMVVGYCSQAVAPSEQTVAVCVDNKKEIEKSLTQLSDLLGGKGTIVHLTDSVTDPNVKERVDIVNEYISKYPDLTLLQTVAELGSAEAATTGVNNLFAQKLSEIDGILATGWQPSMAVANALTAANDKTKKAVVLNMDPAVIQAIKDGYVTGTMMENPYGMAYLPLYVLTLLEQGYKYTGTSPIIDCGTVWIDQSTVANYEQALADSTKALQTEVLKVFSK